MDVARTPRPSLLRRIQALPAGRSVSPITKLAVTAAGERGLEDKTSRLQAEIWTANSKTKRHSDYMIRQSPMFKTPRDNAFFDDYCTYA